MGLAYGLQLKRQYDTWGLVAVDQDRALAGDELVADPALSETRSLVIHAPPREVWPWLAQLGYDRGGWYSFEQLDRPWSPGGGKMGESADRILPEFQDLAEGDLVPTHEQGGFVARVVEPDKQLVLFLDQLMVREQVEQLVADATEDTEAAEAAEAMSEMDVPPFTVSWSFTLLPLSGDRTRLVERLRVGMEGLDENKRRGLPLVRAGVFALMRSQMLGIAERVEAAAAGEEAEAA
jgi:hypothetical protein